MHDAVRQLSHEIQYDASWAQSIRSSGVSRGSIQFEHGEKQGRLQPFKGPSDLNRQLGSATEFCKAIQ